jgi:hypothetical protein
VITGAYLLLALGGILTLAGWVMLLVLGFKKSIGWGLAILFLSWLIIPLVAFLARYWSEAKAGFLLLVTGMAVSGIGWFALVGSVATSAVSEFESFDPSPAEVLVEEPATLIPEPDATPEAAGAEPTSAIAEEMLSSPAAAEAETPTPVVALPTPAGAVLGERVDWQPLADHAGLASFAGELVELKMRDGSVLRVTLDAVTGDELRVTQRVGGGAFSYSVSRSQIAEIRVAR